eukprot:TRINITY_DN11835_c0_g1_i1.p1 TRINITY_DN11835_c0_g1~~TRINITY_DN11835_c0_g1_i1.p1  ORF type:complete len:498 (+),score=143.77 TRINITY_DN11835_c0_g1_i1:88-1494(+)
MAAADWMPPAYLKTLRALMPNDAEYGHVEYLLKLALRSAAVRVLSVHALRSAEDNVRFEREHEGEVVLDSWCSTATLPADNSVPQIVAHGGRFRIADATKGVLFPSGCLRLTPGDRGDDPRNRPGGAMQLEFLHLRLATARSFVMEREQVAEHPVPEGYDSVKLQRDGEDEAGPDGYYHEYVLTDEGRIWPAFVVNCVYDPDDDRRGLAGMHHRVASWRVHCYQDAYSNSMDDLERERRIVEERRRTIVRQLQAIDERMQLVTRNHAHAQDEIYHVVQQVVQLLHSRTQNKLNLLLSDDAELRRQLQYFDFLDSFLGYQKGLLERSLLDPVDFLQNVQRHRDAIADAPSEIVDSYQAVQADIKVVGNLTVQIDDKAAAPVSALHASCGGAGDRGSPHRAATPGGGGVWGGGQRMPCHQLFPGGQLPPPPQRPHQQWGAPTPPAAQQTYGAHCAAAQQNWAARQHSPMP